jgi:hypothetical protein
MNRTDPNIFIETDIIQELKLQAIAYLQKPSLFKEEVLDLHIREVHEQHPINITIINPSDHPLEVSLFLGPEEFANFTIIQQVLMRYFGYFIYINYISISRLYVFLVVKLLQKEKLSVLEMKALKAILN